MAGRDGQPSHVLIAGAGIGGLTAALALSRQGARVTIVERAPEFVEVGAGLQLSPNATRVLRRLGLLDAILARASKPSAIRVRSARSGRTLAFMPLGETAERRWSAPYLVIRRADLQDALARAVEADGAIALHLGTSLAGFGASAGGVRATLKTGALTRTLDADALVGADGIRSSVRARLADPHTDVPRETGRTAWRALVERRAPGHPTELGQTELWLGRNAHLVFYPVAGARLLNVVAITRDQLTPAGATMVWAAPGDPALLKDRFAGWHPTARALIADATAWTTWPLYDRAPLAAWNAGPIALLGDAAHPILPFLAQGAAQAIEDAAALAAAYAGTRVVADAFEAYSRTRLPLATRVQDASRRLGRIYHLAGPAAAARNATMSLLGGHRLLARYDWLYGRDHAAG